MTWLTTREVRSRIRASEATVLALINSGAIRASNISRPGSRRPTWRIEEAAVDDFLRARGTSATPRRDRRREKLTPVTEYIR